MSKQSAIGVLIGFALAAVAVSFWGMSDVASWLIAISECTDEIEIDTSSFWFIGVLSIASLPFFALFQSPHAQKVMLIAVVIWFVATPLMVHRYFLWYGNSQGYDLSPASSPFRLQRAVLVNLHCD